MTSRLKTPPPILRSVRCVPAYDVVRGDTYLKNHQMTIRMQIDETGIMKDATHTWGNQVAGRRTS